MKPSAKFFLGSLLLSGFLLALVGCVADGYVGVHEDVYYGPGYRDPWFHGDSWAYGHRGYSEPRHGGGDVYINPPRLPSPPQLPGLPHPH